MKLNIGKFDLQIKKTKKLDSKLSLSYSDLEEVNNLHLEYLNNLTKNEILNRINSVSVNDLISDNNCIKAQKLLSEKGIFVVPNFLTDDFKHSLLKRTNDTFVDMDKLIGSVDGYYEDENLAIQKNEIRFNKYSKLENYNKPVLTVRQGQDQGMVDIFNYDKLPRLSKLNIKSHFKKTGLNKIINNTSKKELSLSLINIYRNKGISKTRGFHIDGFNDSLKAFVYLSDVNNLSDGPYCFCEKTHLPGAVRNINRALSSKAPNQTESPFVPINSIIPILGKSGTLVVSNQTGIHRGIPQKETAERLLLVARYK